MQESQRKSAAERAQEFYRQTEAEVFAPVRWELMPGNHKSVINAIDSLIAGEMTADRCRDELAAAEAALKPHADRFFSLKKQLADAENQLAAAKAERKKQISAGERPGPSAVIGTLLSDIDTLGELLEEAAEQVAEHSLAKYQHAVSESDAALKFYRSHIWRVLTDRRFRQAEGVLALAWRDFCAHKDSPMCYPTQLTRSITNGRRGDHLYADWLKEYGDFQRAEARLLVNNDD